MSALETFLEGTVRTATPLAFASVGEAVVERSGVINIGLEGAIIAGAFGSFVAAGSGSTWVGFAGAAVAGIAVAAVFAFFAIHIRADQIITGTAISLLGLGLTATLYRQMYGAMGAALSIPTMGVTEIPGLSAIPLIGRPLFAQPAITYVLYLLVPCVWWWMFHTRSGLELRATGEDPRAVIAAGISAKKTQILAVLFGGAMGGISGATLVIAQAGTFAEGMSAGRGFIAIAIVVLGRWHPLGVAAAALIFGAASALQYLFQAMGWSLPYQAFLALPYVLTLLGLAGIAGRAVPPASLARWRD
ncbi:MAG TPA: ABC transporter permease [Gemmatimonadaceae bacterium]|nr:ABC transporter permease [Gemmatimonadaceae bacterium]